jgi:outer membrane lipoprotein-sorting protein
MRALAGLLLFVQAAPSDEAAREALRKLSEKFKDLRTLSCAVTQERRTALLEKPISSSGTMLYRRDPGRLVFRMSDPRTTEIHMDRSTYQVYRPDEKRLERIDFENDELTGRLLMVFQPQVEEVGKTFAVRAGAAKEGETEIRLEPQDKSVLKRLTRLCLTVRSSDGALLRIVYEDAEGDEVKFELKDVRLNPDLPAEAFELKVPEGTRVFRHAMKSK